MGINVCECFDLRTTTTVHFDCAHTRLHIYSRSRILDDCRRAMKQDRWEAADCSQRQELDQFDSLTTFV